MGKITHGWDNSSIRKAGGTNNTERTAFITGTKMSEDKAAGLEITDINFVAK